MTKHLPGILFLLISHAFFAQKDTTRRIVLPKVSPTLKFTENKGQWDNPILFKAQLDGGVMFIEKTGLTFNLYDKKKYRALHHGGILKGTYKDLNLAAQAYKISFEGASQPSSVEKAQAGSDYENYFLGNDQSKWASEVKNYHQVWLRNLYKGIDYEAITSNTGFKYNFHVNVHADPSLIRLKYQGVDKIKLKDGILYLKLEVNNVIEQKPYAYQLIHEKVKEVRCNYKLKDNVLSFDLPDGYDKNYELVIDPILAFAAQSGSTADNFGMTATYDTQGNLYSGGTAFNIGYPTTIGAYSIVFNGPTAQGNTDVVITKYNSTGNALLFSTYLGGAGTEIVTSLIVDKNDNLCFYGATGSSNFPISTGAYDNSFNGGVPLSFVYNGTTFNSGTDIYIGKFNSAGSILLACTYFGGSDNDGVNHVNVLTPLPFPNSNIYEYQTDSLQHNYGDQYRGEIQLDVSNNIYIASSTRSSDFPVLNAYDNSLGGKQDAVVAKFNSSLTQLVYSTYLGGNLNDCGNSLIVNNNSEIYVGGGTCSSDFPSMPGANSLTYNGGKTDGFLTHLNANGNGLLQSTFVGTNDYDQVYFVQSDVNNNIYVYGQSLGNMPVVNSATATVYSNPGTHQFITRYNNSLSTINMATVFGYKTTDIDISPAAFAVDKCSNIYLSGWGGGIIPPYLTTMSNMPLAFPTQSTTDGHDFYLMGLTPNAAGLSYGSYFGGNLSEEHVDGGTSRFDPLGKIYQSVCAGCGGHDDFPVTPGAWPGTPGNPNHNTDDNNCNNGVFKIDFQLLITVSTINSNTVAGCVPLTISFTNATAPTDPGSSFIWYLGDGTTNSTVINPVYTYTDAGTYVVSLVVFDPNSCDVKDSSSTFITVYPTPTVSFSFSLSPCSSSITTTNSSFGNFGNTPYIWNFGDGNTSTLPAPDYFYPVSGNYTLSLTAIDQNGCSSVVSKSLAVLNFITNVTNLVLCNGASSALNASGGTSYTWSPTTGLSTGSGPSPVAHPSVTTIYTLNIENNSLGYACLKTLTTQVQVNPSPTANFNFSINPCGGGTYFTDLSSPDVTNWYWQLSASQTSTVQNPYYFYQYGGNFNVRLTTSNSYGCTDTITKPISVPIPPFLSINSNTAVCKGSSVKLNASGGVSYIWTPTVSLDDYLSDSPNASPQTNTEYSVLVTTSNYANGKPCQFLLTTFVGISLLSSVPVSAQANPTLIITGNSTTLTYIGDPGALVTWYPAGSTSPSTGYTVSASPNQPTTYTAIASSGACRQSAQVLVDAYSDGCLDKDVFIPNTFTPNGDNQNDIFIARGLKIEDVYFAVYNRWGELMFETSDKSKGWDGNYKGKPAEVGVFGWYLKVKCINGAETFRKGNVTLIR